MKRIDRWCIFGMLVLLILQQWTICAADEGAITPAQLAFFESKIRPVLVGHCYSCHSVQSQIVQAGLYLDSRSGMLRGGDSGPVILPGRAAGSLLMKALRHDGLEMPPKERLSDSILRDFETWIAEGAPDPRATDQPAPSREIDLEQGRRHWAFQPVLKPSVPDVMNKSWPLHALDHFVLHRLENSGLRPVDDADRYTWLRRVTLDLTGLPPTPAEIDLFVRDNSPHACERVVDRLLSSRAYGERWARHWLDLTGYADMVGTSNNVFAQHAWRYRDYLIEAYYQDKPFDRFVREQIAGDLLSADTPQEQAANITATGFLMVGDVEIVEPDKAKMVADHVDTQIIKIGTAFLGMTLGCVRCHDHKFDPIGLPDYYGIAGILHSSPSTHKIPFGVWSMLNASQLPESPEQLALRLQREAEHQETLAGLKNQRAQLENEKQTAVDQLTLLEQTTRAGQSTNGASAPPTGPATDPTAAALVEAQSKQAELTKRRDELTAKIQQLARPIQHAEFFASQIPKAFAMSDGPHPADMPIHIRGNPYAPGSIVPRGTVRVASWQQFPEIPAGQSGRLQLAEWLADRQNPLTPRVAVNRIWQKLFGEGIVRSVDYFGTRGEQPTHPALLDYLAWQFMDNGWSQKQLIRTIVLSRTYRLGSMNNLQAQQIDPDNRLLWRMHRQRLDAESLRDSLLAVSYQLQPGKGGPALVLEEPENCGDLVQQGVNPPNYSHRKPRRGEEFQRTIYLPVLRTNTATHDRLRTFFDFVDPAQIAGQRSQTIAPTQSLFVLNNDLFRNSAKALTDQLVAASPQSDQRLSELWLRVYGRPITTTERDDALSFLSQLDAMLSTTPATSPANLPDVTARETLCWLELCHSLLASNEFLFRI